MARPGRRERRDVVIGRGRVGPGGDLRAGDLGELRQGEWTADREEARVGHRYFGGTLTCIVGSFLFSRSSAFAVMSMVG